MRLLIVDDSNIVRNRIARIATLGAIPGLRVAGLAKNGAEAVDLCMKATPDVVTMDLTMPEMDGIECIAQLIALGGKFRILVISALADKATALRAMKLGAHGFIHKPFTDEQLTAALLELKEPI
jgi:two-component system chemotaxis response regulator CheY